MNWLDIDTAPRDGRRILLWDGEWASAGAWVGYDSMGWVMDCYDFSKGEFPEPTHWMPLPPPPNEP